jgi:hypothetical protein
VIVRYFLGWVVTKTGATTVFCRAHVAKRQRRVGRSENVVAGVYTLERRMPSPFS